MMHKKILLIVLLLSLGIGISIVILSINAKEPVLERTMSDDIKAWLVEETLTRSGCIVVIREGEPPRGMGDLEFWCYTIDVLEDNKWKELPLKPGAELPNFETIAGQEASVLPKSVIDPENAYGDYGEIDVKVNWEELYGRLENGEYRIVKWKTYVSDKEAVLYKEYFYIPFTIDDTVK